MQAGGTSYVYSFNGISSQTDSSGTTYYTRCSCAKGTLVDERTPSGAYYYLFDGLGSIVGLTDSNGTLVSTYQYDPYGNLTSSTGSVANPWRFAAGYFDSSTGLYKYGTRYYNPGFGRWSQQDPVRGQLNDPTSLNRYLYAGDDPVNFTDPSGKDTLGCGEAIIASLAAFLYRGTSPCGSHGPPRQIEPHHMVQCIITITSTREPGVTLCQSITLHQN